MAGITTVLIVHLIQYKLGTTIQLVFYLNISVIGENEASR